MEGHSAHFSLKRGGVGQARKHAAYVIGADKYSSREDIAHVRAGNMPSWAAVDPLLFWDAADNNERANGRTYHEFEFAIPREITLEEAKELVEAWITESLGERHPWMYGIHQKLAEDGLPNIHCHLMFSDRIIDGVERSTELFFRRPATRYRNKKTGELREPDAAKGGAGKDRRWNDRQIVKELRTRWQALGNKFLSDHNHRPRLDLRSNADRGLSEPEPKIGPTKRKDDKWREMNREKVKTIRQKRRRVRVLREEIQSVKRELRTAQRERASQNACACREDSRTGQRPYRSPLGGMNAERRNGRTLYRWNKGAAAGLAAIVDRGDRLSLCGKTSSPKVRALVELAKAKGWKSLVLTGSDEFKRLAVREALREGLKVANLELAELVAEIRNEEEKQMQAKQNKANERTELARRWLATAAPVNALEAAALKNDPDCLMQLFQRLPEARRWELMERQRAQGVPEPLLGYHIDEKGGKSPLEGVVRHVGKHVWVEPVDRPGVVVPVDPSQQVRAGQQVAVRHNGQAIEIQVNPDREDIPRPR